MKNIDVGIKIFKVIYFSFQHLKFTPYNKTMKEYRNNAITHFHIFFSSLPLIFMFYYFYIV